MNPGLIGGIIGGIVGVAGGLLGTYFSIKNTKGPRERAFVIKASIASWIFVLAFVFGLCLIPGLYKLFLIPIYVVGLVAGILLGNKKQAQIRLEESKKQPHRFTNPTHSPQMPAVRRGTETGRVGRALPGLPASTRHCDRRWRAAWHAAVHTAHNPRSGKTFSATGNP